MKLHHLRSATFILEFHERIFLIDPMLSAPGALPAFKMLGRGRARNPLVPLPAEAEVLLEAVTDVIVTHEHPDHFDAEARAWVRDRNLPVWASPVDVPSLAQTGLDVRRLDGGELDAVVELIPVRHGRGWVGWMMGPVSGFYLAFPGSPSVLTTSDAILSNELLAAVKRLAPDVLVAPAGAANFGFGGDILFSMAELMILAEAAPRHVVFNHLEALDHCPTTRNELEAQVTRAGLADRVWIPADGDSRTFWEAGSPATETRAFDAKPGLQKTITRLLV